MIGGIEIQRVLLVEDELSIAEPFAAALARNGFEPLIAGTASEALRLGREAAPAVVLLDLSLPDGDGRDVCRELRRFSDVPIIMLTARGTVTDRVVGLELGADDYVVKPFAVGEVISRIRAVLRRARASSPPRTLTVGEIALDLAARRAWVAGVEIELTRKEFDLLGAPRERGRRGRLPRNADVRGLGRELVRLDEDARRAHLGVAAQAREARGRVHPDCAGRRLPHGPRRGSGVLTRDRCASGPVSRSRSPTCYCWRSSRSACRSR